MKVRVNGMASVFANVKNRCRWAPWRVMNSWDPFLLLNLEACEGSWQKRAKPPSSLVETSAGDDVCGSVFCEDGNHIPRLVQLHTRVYLTHGSSRRQGLSLLQNLRLKGVKWEVCCCHTSSHISAFVSRILMGTITNHKVNMTLKNSESSGKHKHASKFLSLEKTAILA